MRRCAVMGDTESVQGFAAVGLDIFPCDDPAEAGALLRRLAAAGEPGREEYGVIYLTERLAALLEPVSYTHLGRKSRRARVPCPSGPG